MAAGQDAGHVGGLRSDAALGNLPLVYPFLVNDPGRGRPGQAASARSLVDHLIPPMARAESYGDIARWSSCSTSTPTSPRSIPASCPRSASRIWTLIRAAKMDHDLGLTERPEDDSFDDMILHIDGWLCEIKDVQIRDGLHILGRTPTGEAELDLVLAILRARQLFGGEHVLPGLRQALGLAEDGSDSGPRWTRLEAAARHWSGRCRPPGGIRMPSTGSPTTQTSQRCCGSRPPRWCRGWPALRPRSSRCYEL